MHETIGVLFSEHIEAVAVRNSKAPAADRPDSAIPAGRASRPVSSGRFSVRECLGPSVFTARRKDPVPLFRLQNGTAHGVNIFEFSLRGTSHTMPPVAKKAAYAMFLGCSDSTNPATILNRILRTLLDTYGLSCHLSYFLLSSDEPC